jgi:hypothetical protein
LSKQRLCNPGKEKGMPFDPKSLVFALEIKDPTTNKAALRLADGIGQPFEVEFDCGRTSGTPGSTYVIGGPALAALKEALRKTLEALES